MSDATLTDATVPAAHDGGVAVPTRRRRRRTDGSSAAVARGSSRWVVLGVLVLLALYAVAPLWWLLVSATKSRGDLYRSNGMWFTEFHLVENLQALFTYQDGIFTRWLWNTVVYSGLSSLGLTAVALAAGYGIAKYRYRGRGLTMGLIIGSFLIPGSLLIVPTFILFTRIGFYDTIWAMILPGMFGPFSVYLAKVYAEGAVPSELMEAARIDGAGEYRIFFLMGARMMSTAGATIFLLHFVATWNTFMWPLVFLKGADKWPVMLGLYSWLRRGIDSQYDLTGLVITGSLVSTIPMVLLMIAMQRYWRSGVTIGSLK
ncbi:carbohydrate ABC transporter permease [Plantactinospora sp. KLBMP9567]|uniref:carbohydrate ABC transporter permease n=1 Tax=Plantactinospora sp. KLBMP9567 TaxID=3085900 RepID=UPI002981B970|nr:carbohydrate ABC transporter permease [Plantactinospora sp. KLBMP9567]MDW5330262.1 carbohydrate ABC transporter permease [Plantactinospora sp. KLBMP9567]